MERKVCVNIFDLWIGVARKNRICMPNMIEEFQSKNNSFLELLLIALNFLVLRLNRDYS